MGMLDTNDFETELDFDADVTWEDLDVKQKRMIADPDDPNFEPYWTPMHPMHGVAVQTRAAILKKMEELESGVETSPPVEHPATSLLNPDEASEKLNAMKNNPEVRKILARGKKHPLYAQTYAEWTSLHQLAYDHEEEAEAATDSWDPFEGRLESSALEDLDPGVNFTKHSEYVESIIDRAKDIDEVEAAFWDFYEKYGDPDKRGDMEDMVSFYTRNHGNLADRLNRTILKTAFLKAVS